jgi:putative FmdB family regulatory protein
MPVYEYECTSCGQSFERLQNVGARAPRTCPHCNKPGTVRRRVSAPAFQFKGSGWYVTDYAGKGKDAKKGEAAAAESGGDDKPPKTGDQKADGEKAGGKKGDKAESKPKPSKAATKGDD